MPNYTFCWITARILKVYNRVSVLHGSIHFRWKNVTQFYDIKISKHRNYEIKNTDFIVKRHLIQNISCICDITWIFRRLFFKYIVSSYLKVLVKYICIPNAQVLKE